MGDFSHNRLNTKLRLERILIGEHEFASGGCKGGVSIYTPVNVQNEAHWESGSSDASNGREIEQTVHLDTGSAATHSTFRIPEDRTHAHRAQG